MTEDMVRFFNGRLGQDLTPIFDQYFRRTALPTLELDFGRAAGSVAYRWKADVPGFAMPIRVGTKGKWQIVRPTTEWKTMKTPLTRETFEVATDLYYVNVTKMPVGATLETAVRTWRLITRGALRGTSRPTDPPLNTFGASGIAAPS